MKKRLLLILCPILVLTAAAGIYFALNRELVADVSAENWDRSGEFLLGSFAAKRVNSSSFIPEDEADFLKQAESSENYIGTYNYPWSGCKDNPCRMYYYNGGIFALMEWNDAGLYELLPCKTNFSSYDNGAGNYAYPSPGDYYPKWEGRCYTLDNDYWSFDFVFGTYEEACEKFYNYLDEEVVSFDSENQIIRCHPYSYDRGEIDTAKWVVIDFVNQTVGFDFGEET